MSSQENQLFIGNLSFKLTEDDLRIAFEPFGSITEIKIPIDRQTGKKRGFAFITYQTSDEAKRALTMNGKEVEGRALRVNIAEGKKDFNSGGRN